MSVGKIQIRKLHLPGLVGRLVQIMGDAVCSRPHERIAEPEIVGRIANDQRADRMVEIDARHLFQRRVTGHRPPRERSPDGVAVDQPGQAPLVIVTGEDPVMSSWIARLVRTDQRDALAQQAQVPRRRAPEQPVPDDDDIELDHRRNLRNRLSRSRPEAVGQYASSRVNGAKTPEAWLVWPTHAR